VSAVADKNAALQELGVEVLSVSVDSHFVHKMWNNDELVKMVGGGVPFHIVADQAGNVGRAFGVWDENQGVELRGRFIIDPDGVIQAMEVLTPPVGRKSAETIRQINAFQLVRASKGTEARPAGWEPGQATLTPGADLVGNAWRVWQPKQEKKRRDAPPAPGGRTERDRGGGSTPMLPRPGAVRTRGFSAPALTSRRCSDAQACGLRTRSR
jgi:alkyl hydroperoxide reductase subunit AhpC